MVVVEEYDDETWEYWSSKRRLNERRWIHEEIVFDQFEDGEAAQAVRATMWMKMSKRKGS